MGKIYQVEYTIPYYQSDACGNVLVSSLLSVLLQTSGVQSVKLGRSDDWILKHFGLTWIVTDYAIEIERLPKFMETVTIETEVTSYNKLFCYRNYRVFLDGQLIVKVHSSWVLMEFENRKLSRVVEEVVAPYESEVVKKIERGHKFAPLEEIQETETCHVGFSDIDRNRHVNNVKYYEWAIDTLDFDFLVSHYPKKIFIKYSHEVLYGDEVVSSLEKINNVTHHKINDDSAFLEITWAEYENADK